MSCPLAVISHNIQYYRLRLVMLYQGQSDEPFGGYCDFTSTSHDLNVLTLLLATFYSDITFQLSYTSFDRT